jgi:hypothetical protein
MNGQEWGNLTALRTCAEIVTDKKGQRIADENRALRGGAAIDADHQQRLCAIARRAEADAEDLLMEVYESEVPAYVREWAASVPGLGSGITFPRLVGMIGNPHIAIPYEWQRNKDGKRELVQAGPPYERSVRQLWQWCGCGDPECKPAAGMSQEQLLRCGKLRSVRPVLRNFTDTLSRSGRPVSREDSPKFGQPKSQLVADSEYFKILDAAKQQGLTRVHQWPCHNKHIPPMKPNGCGITQHREWGEPGSQWRPGHAEGHAARVTAKAFLKDFWQITNEQSPDYRG